MALLHALSRAGSEAKSQMDIDDSEEMCCPLPFLLQDLCLLVVVNELDCYPTELLATLPYWLRYRILSIAPALDLARLEHTPVANGVDTDEIWKSRPKANEQDSHARQLTTSTEGSNPFHFDVTSSFSTKDSLPFILGVGFIITGDHSLIEHISKDLEVGPDNQFSIGNQSMIEIASALLTASKETLTDILHLLLSVQGSLVLSNLVTGCLHQDCKNPVQCNQKAWKRQATTLVVKDFRTNSSPYHSRYYIGSHEDVQLTPCYYMDFFEHFNPVKLMFTLCTHCQLCPHGINICVNSISSFFLRSLCAERLSLDGNLSLPTKDARCTSIINSFFKNVVSLRLQCDNYGHIGLVVNMIEAATANGQASSLKHFIYDMPDLYLDVIGSLCALFSLPNFHLLMLKVSDMCSHTLSKLLRAFIIAPCPHVQKLIIYVEHSPRFQLMLTENLVASLDMKGMHLPSCSLQHKVLKFFTNDSLIKA